jgi:SAM-dependent methyltransferase
MAYINSLAVFISFALSTEPGSAERRETLATLESIRRKNPDDLVLGLVCDLLAGKRVYGDVTFTDEHAASFSSFFTNSPIIANMRDEICAWGNYFIDGLPGFNLNFADLGCGDGQAIGKVIQRCVPLLHRHVKLFLNDTHEQMISVAEKHVRSLCQDLSTSVEIYPCIGSAEEPRVAEEMKSFFADEMKNVMVTAIFSIHHMPYKTKLALLTQMAAIQPRLFVLGDANSEHDIHHLPKSPEIVANAMRGYNNYYRSLKENGAPEEVLKAARFFLGSEARNVIMNDLDKRIDYHTTVDHWKELLEMAGFTIVNPNEAVPYRTDAPARRVSSTHFDSFVYEGESLCFSLGAQVHIDKGA